VLWLPPTETTTSAWHKDAYLLAVRAEQLACQVANGPIIMSPKNTSANTDAEAGMINMPTHQTKITAYPGDCFLSHGGTDPLGEHTVAQTMLT
jgi:hypothetical protein